MSNWNNMRKAMILLCLLLLVFVMVLFVPDRKEWGAFCGAVAILYAILGDKPGRTK